jgi:hypothetical protein
MTVWPHALSFSTETLGNRMRGNIPRENGQLNTLKPQLLKAPATQHPRGSHGEPLPASGRYQPVAQCGLATVVAEAN